MAKKHSSFTKLLTTLAFVFFIASIVSYEISSSKLTGAASKNEKKVSTKKDSDVYEMLELFGRAFEITKTRYVDDVDNKKLIKPLKCTNYI